MWIQQKLTYRWLQVDISFQVQVNHLLEILYLTYKSIHHRRRTKQTGLVYIFKYFYFAFVYKFKHTLAFETHIISNIFSFQRLVLHGYRLLLELEVDSFHKYALFYGLFTLTRSCKRMMHGTGKVCLWDK